jgi:hypothetical protein
MRSIPIDFDDSIYEDTVSGDNFRKQCNKKFFPSNVDSSYDTSIEENDVWFIKRDYVPKFFSILPNDCPRINIVTQYSDYETDDTLARMKPRCVRKIFGPNCTTEASNIIPIPLGIGPHFCPITPKAKDLAKINTKKDRKKLLYVNFRPATFQQERGPLMDRFVDLFMSGQKWITIGNQPCDPRIVGNYLEELTDHKFCVCPRGNGIDTHRMWESLYCKTIPIVRYTNAHRNFRDLPILFVNDWSEVTEELLHTKYEQFLTTEWNYSKLRASWWGNRFKLFE